MSGTPGYPHLHPGEVMRTVQVNTGSFVDLDDRDRILGVETLSGEDWRGVLATLAMSGRLTIPERRDLWP